MPVNFNAFYTTNHQLREENTRFKNQLKACQSDCFDRDERIRRLMQQIDLYAKDAQAARTQQLHNDRGTTVPGKVKYRIMLQNLFIPGWNFIVDEKDNKIIEFFKFEDAIKKVESMLKCGFAADRAIIVSVHNFDIKVVG